MKQSSEKTKLDFREALLRVTALVIEVLIIYTVYITLASRLPEYGHFSLVIPVVFSILGFGVNYISFKGMKKEHRSLLIVAGGVALSIVSSLILQGISNLVASLLVLLFFILLWNRAIKYFYEEYEFIYSVDQFYKSAAVLIVLNLYTNYTISAVVFAPIIRAYTVLYIAAAIILMFEMRSVKYLRHMERKHPLSEILFTILILAATFVMSSPKFIAAVYLAIKAVLKPVTDIVIKVAVIIATPIAYVFEWIIRRLKPMLASAAEKMGLTEEGIAEREAKELADVITYDSEMFQRILKVASTVILLIMLVVITYLIYKYIDRYVRSKKSDGYTEDKEFVLDLKGSGISALINNFKGTISDLYKRAAFNLTADNREKLRHEYKCFLLKLYSKNIIGEENHTAWEVLEIISKGYPGSNTYMEHITQSYEEVRYGTKQPGNSELKRFRADIDEVYRILG
ncbi:MAG: DUF4129 domain-containing protein [Bacillota bacterium]